MFPKYSYQQIQVLCVHVSSIVFLAFYSVKCFFISEIFWKERSIMYKNEHTDIAVTISNFVFEHEEQKCDLTEIKNEMTEVIEDKNESKIIEKSETKLKQCNLCGNYLHERSLNRHMAEVHDVQAHLKILSKKNKNQKKTNGPSTYVCDFCDKFFETKNLHKLHLDSVHTENLNECKYCKKPYSNQKELKYHIKVVHERKDIQKCELCFKTYTGVKSLGRHKKEVHAKQASHKCDFCEKVFKRPTLLKIHVDSIHCIKPNTMYQCNLCERTFPGNSDLYNHNVNTHNARRYKSNLKVEQKSIKHGPSAYVCELCDQFFASKRIFKEHVSTHKIVDKPFVKHEEQIISESNIWEAKKNENYALKSSFHFEREDKTYLEKVIQEVSIDIHETWNNSTSVTTSIRQEPKVVQEPEKENLIDSRMTNDKIEIRCHQCNLCGKYFSRINHLNSHITQTHKKIRDKSEIKLKKKRVKIQEKRVKIQKKNEVNGPSAYICEWCDKLFTRRKDHTEHVQSVHNENLSNECQHCKKLYSNQKALKYHIKVVHERKMIQKCDICSKTYTGIKSLSRHKKEVHTKQFNHKCDFCDRVFQRLSLLKAHINSFHSETSNNPYKCNLCDKVFPHNSNLYHHLAQIHNVQRYAKSCTACEMSVNSLAELNYHIKTYHEDETSLKCVPCKKGFKRMKVFLNHSKKFHWDFI